jgi:hypothetical protein
MPTAIMMKTTVMTLPAATGKWCGPEPGYHS